jgi:hypothetical protein
MEVMSFNSRDLLVLPSGRTTNLCTVEGDRIDEIAPLDCPPLAAWALSNAGWVACLSREGRAVSLARVDAACQVSPRPDLSLPDGYEAACLAFRGDVLYVGGACGREAAGLFDLALERPAWTRLDLPENLRKDGKRIDALLVDGGRLVAVDDLIVPKWLLTYDAADPRWPRLAAVFRLPVHGTYEHIVAATLGTDWLAVFSTTVGMFGEGRHVGLLDRRALRPYGGVSWSSRSWTYGGTVQTTEPPWEAIAFQGDVLFIAWGLGGLGVLDLSEVERPAEPPTMDDRGRLEDRGFSASCEERLRRIPAGEAGEVVGVVAVPGGDRPVLVVREGEEHRCMLFAGP